MPDVIDFAVPGVPDAPTAPRAFTEEDLRVIAGRASTLDQRLASPSPVTHVPKDGDAERRANRLERWCNRAAAGDDALFRKRLAWDALDVDDAERATRPARWRSDAPLPRWVHTLDGAVAEAMRAAPLHRPDLLDPASPLPFEELIAPFVTAARRTLDGTLSAVGLQQWTNRFLDTATCDLERHLLASLARLCSNTLFAEFTVHCAVAPFLAVETSEETDDSVPNHATDRRAYRSFIQAMQTSELRTFFLEYSVLGRLVATRIDQWVTNTHHLVRRLYADGDDVAALIAPEGATPRIDAVRNVSEGLSDPHHGGATTHILTFESGARVVYKPKPMALYAAFQRLLEWCNRAEAAPDLYVTDVIARPEYGWVECITMDACTTETECQAYFRRAGALLCVAYILNGEDFHRGNVIAHGSHPVFIDTEILLCPSLLRDLSLTNQNRADARLVQTVLRTGLLPMWNRNREPGEGPSFVNVGGLFDVDQQTIKRAGWDRVNTDAMRPAIHSEAAGAPINVPRRDGDPVDPANYLSDLLDGFDTTYRLLESRSDDLLRPDGPLAAMRGLRSRFLFRKTNIYATILRQLRHPNVLREGIDRDIELEFLAQGYVKLDEKPAYWPVVAAERRALNQLDVPLFRTATDRRHLYASNGDDLGECFQTAGFDISEAKVSHLDRSDRILQSEIIRGAFYSADSDDAHEGAVPHRTAPSSGIEPDRPRLTPAEALEGARLVADRLEQTQLHAEAEQTTWMSLIREPVSGRFHVQNIGANLHDGRCGIALFFAALRAVSTTRANRARYRELARETIRPVTEDLTTHPEPLLTRLKGKIGATVGVGSLVYSLTHLAALLDDPRYLDAATDAAALIRPDSIRADEDLDLISGAAGGLMSLLALYRATGDASVLDQARSCGTHLLASRVPAPHSGILAWPTLHGRFYTGFSHGASGIAHALLELHRETGPPELVDAAVDGFDFEATLALDSQQNWRRFVDPSQRASAEHERPWSTWCHGATGIGLARAAHCDRMRDSERRDLDHAIATTTEVLFTNVDHVCCGDAGRILFLATAAHALNRTALHTRALQAAATMLDRARHRGRFALTSNGHDHLKPGFLQGLSGIGYTLLYLAHPDRLPAVHLFR